MSQTRPNIILPANTWVDIYAALNAQAGEPAVAVGAKLKAENLGKTTIKAVSADAMPSHHDGYNEIRIDAVRTNEEGDPGAWFCSMGDEGLVNVTVIV